MNKPELIIDGVSSLKAILEKNEIEYDIEPKISVFIHILKKVKDFRVKGRTIYKLENILALCFILIMKDEFKSFNYASKYIEYHKDYFEKLGLIENGNIPSHDALRRIFMCLDANTLRDRFINRIKEFYYKILSNYNSKAKISLYNADGKEFRSSGRNFQNKILCNANVFNIYNSSEAICLSSTPLMDKESEIPEFQRMISKFNLKNVVVTADALRCQKDSAKAVISRKGNYVFTVKKKSKEFVSRYKRKNSL